MLTLQAINAIQILTHAHAITFTLKFYFFRNTIQNNIQTHLKNNNNNNTFEHP